MDSRARREVSNSRSMKRKTKGASATVRPLSYHRLPACDRVTGRTSRGCDRVTTCTSWQPMRPAMDKLKEALIKLHRGAPRSGGQKVARGETSGAQQLPAARRRRAQKSGAPSVRESRLISIQTLPVWLPSGRRSAANQFVDGLRPCSGVPEFVDDSRTVRAATATTTFSVCRSLRPELLGQQTTNSKVCRTSSDIVGH